MNFIIGCNGNANEISKRCVIKKGLIEGKSFGEAVRDSGTSVWFSKNFGLFIKYENVKRLMSSSMSKVAENIYNTLDKSLKDLKNESK